MEHMAPGMMKQWPSDCLFSALMDILLLHNEPDLMPAVSEMGVSRLCQYVNMRSNRGYRSIVG